MTFHENKEVLTMKTTYFLNNKIKIVKRYL